MHAHGAASHGDPDLLPVSITVSVIAVLLALVTLLGHRAHTHTIYAQNQSIAQWVYYESKAAGRTGYDALLDALSVIAPKEAGVEAKLRDKFRQKMEHSDRDQKEIRAKADQLELEVAHQEIAADRFDAGDVCLEAALVIVSITMLTKRRLYWVIGIVLACVGLAIAATGFFVA